ncbi:hypothetical protein ASPCAL13774 [Aspergillus calidoustus]|uniref:Uncharacterized protein n=1 Tax=Aspergillus calidoustus TaxID=454130 RepID=A0A0U5GE86_ASPCI|nr:hypothetical protein ASPCAL13774 [Aspergillus calidoustus]
MASQSNFMFIDSQADHAHNLSLRNKKQVFVMTKYYQDQKQASIDRLKPRSAPRGRRRLEHGAGTFPSTAKDRETAKHKGSKDNLPQRKPPIWSLEAYLSQSFVDPLASSAVGMTDSMNQYFHHFRIHSIIMCYPLDPMRMGMWWWQEAITQPALLLTILFLSAGHQASLEMHNGVDPLVAEKTFRNCLRLRGRVLGTLKDIMEDPKKAVAEATALIIASLASGETVNANFEALEIHMKGLQRLVHLLGGVEAIDHGALAKIYECDVRSATLKNTRPVFAMSSRFRSEILQHAKFFHTQEPLAIPRRLSQLGQSFFKALWYTQLDSSVRAYTQILHRLIIHYEEAQVCPSLITPTDNDLFLVFEHQLLSASYTSRPDDPHEPLRLSFLLYVNLRIWHFQGIPLTQYPAAALRASLEASLAHILKVAPDLLFWILWMGGLASRGAECYAWFVENLRTVANQLGLQNWVAARILLGGFFYTDQHGWEAEKAAEGELWREVVPEAHNETHHTPVIFI